MCSMMWYFSTMSKCSEKSLSLRGQRVTGVEIFRDIPMLTRKHFCSALSAVKKVLIDCVLGTLDPLEGSLSTERQTVEGK